jgi:signal transduction histidine kinase
VRPGAYLDILEDPAGDLTFEQVRAAPPERWRPNRSQSPNLGFSSSAFWFRLRVVNEAGPSRRTYLEVRSPTIDHLDLYLPSADGWVVKRAGDQLRFAEREVYNRHFIFRLNPDEGPATYYIRVRTGWGVSLPAVLRSERDLRGVIDHEQFLLGAYYGLVAIILIFNLFLYIYLRLGIYIYFILATTSSTVLFLGWNGLLFQYLWPGAYPMQNGMLVWVSALLNFWGLQFARAFLDTPRNAPGLDRMMLAVMLVAILTPPVMLLVGKPLSYSLFILVVLLVLAGHAITGTYCLYREVRSARFYALALGVTLISAMISTLRIAGLVEDTFFTRHCFQIGTAVQLTVISLALGDRINQMRREREVARAESLAQRRRADLLKDQFLSNISHELRTPLAEVYGYAEILIDERDGVREDLRPMTVAVHRASSRLSELFQDLMLLTNLDTDLVLDEDVLSVRQLLEKNLKQMRHLIADRGLVVVRRQAEEIQLRGDAALLSRALYHVLKNGVLYNRDGGLLEVDVVAEAGRVTISVRDTGMGMEKDEQERIWDKFYRVDSSLTYSVQGVGLGLFVARRILDLHDGRIDVESELHIGSKFVISLPRLVEENSLPADAANPGAAS